MKQEFFNEITGNTTEFVKQLFRECSRTLSTLTTLAKNNQFLTCFDKESSICQILTLLAINLTGQCGHITRVFDQHVNEVS